ncbi:MAG: hypothetical protein KKE44_05795 [Proteobacteria bacterium]|nr:hypothetical protein [Pseudomonadota bacterium]MBU1582242.1 hypothetical protein [Pseudomonadota bacterium]MBU2456046.1 hypothetical protein [Pseudomonadota bacterium]
MKKIRHFDIEELLKVDEAVKVSEELVNNYFKLSSGQWLKNRYDIKTAKDLALHEYVDGPFAQVIKYEGRKKDVSLGSSCFSLYTVCLQDSAILSTIGKTNGLLLESFLLYILTHELVHVVRFLKFKQRYENKSEVDVTLDEERKVHYLTHAILKQVSMPGLKQVFEFYKDWLHVPGDEI